MALSDNMKDEPFLMILKSDVDSEEKHIAGAGAAAAAEPVNLIAPSTGVVSAGFGGSFDGLVGGAFDTLAGKIFSGGILSMVCAPTTAIFAGSPQLTLTPDVVDNIRLLWNRRYGDIGKFYPDLDELMRELKGHGVPDVRGLLQKAIAKDCLSEHPALQLALTAYTSTSLIDAKMTLHKALNIANVKKSKEFQSTSMHLLSALQHLPYEWTTVYRGNDFPDVENIYKKGAAVIWGSFCSTTRDITVAERFAGRGSNATIFQIEAYCGRFIKEMSEFPSEEEVLFPPLTAFKVISVGERKLSRSNRMVRCVRLEQLHLSRGLKCILWVDDNPPNNKSIMEQAEKDGVCFIMLKSTEDAINFLKDGCNSYLLKEPLTRFRIITDMKRGDDNAAGATFIKLLRTELSYDKTVLVFTNYAPGSIARLEEQHVAYNVKVTTTIEEAEEYAIFHKRLL